MSFAIHDFVRLRPFVYHLTSVHNLPRIQRERRLYPTEELARQAGQPMISRVHRPTALPITIDGEVVYLRDQAPLKTWNLTLTEDWTFGDVVELLNRRVFFWPGREGGPIASGQRHFARYADEAVSILRVPTDDLVGANAERVPEFCKWNSGAPRWSRGIRPKRGPDTFFPAERAPYGAAQVVELTFTGPVTLPDVTQVAPSAAGPWRTL